MRYTTFKALPIGAKFFCNGNECQKVSSRTGKLLAYDRTFYFEMDSVVRAAQ